MENFEKLKLSATYGSEPHQLDYLYDMQIHKIKRVEFFTSNVTIDKTHWFYLDKYEDVSIYYFKSESANELAAMNTSLTNLTQLASSSTITNPNPIILQSSTGIAVAALVEPTSTSSVQSTCPSGTGSLFKVKSTSSMEESNNSQQQHSSSSVVVTATTPSRTTSHTPASTSISASLFMQQKNESFNDKLKLWKCCTLVKHPGLTLDKIVHRIKYERQLWDDDFKEGRVVETLDDQTDLHRYVVNFMPPHPSRDFFEIR